ncbi:hypothetical protein AB0B10_25160 [Micromonospora arborensis]|uniref:hypothetical protein n=1 Tax=Micromonospora arborensis TaxID=2116518 RepID=UPI0033C2D9FB
MKTLFGYAVVAGIFGLLGHLLLAAVGPDVGTLGSALKVLSNFLMGLGALVALTLAFALFVLSMRTSKD